MISCAEYAAKLLSASRDMKANLLVPTETAMQIAKEESRAAIGTYAFGWPALAASTLEHKRADTPLYETGSLRDSLKTLTALTPVGAEGLLYTDEIVGLYQELGTTRGIPPRSFLYKAIVHSIPRINATFADYVLRTLRFTT